MKLVQKKLAQLQIVFDDVNISINMVETIIYKFKCCSFEGSKYLKFVLLSVTYPIC